VSSKLSCQCASSGEWAALPSCRFQRPMGGVLGGQWKFLQVSGSIPSRLMQQAVGLKVLALHREHDDSRAAQIAVVMRTRTDGGNQGARQGLYARQEAPWQLSFLRPCWCKVKTHPEDERADILRDDCLIVLGEGPR
jgi:hypothetical protein